MNALHNVVAGRNKSVMVQDLFFQCIFEFFNVLKCKRISCLKSHQLAGSRIDTIVQNKFYHLTHIDISGIRGSVRCAASRSRLDTANDSPVSCLFDGTSLTKRHLHRCFIIEETRICLPVLYHLATFAEQFFRCSIPGSHCHYRLSGF